MSLIMNLSPAERVERAMNHLCELVCENGPTHLVKGMPSYQSHESILRCIQALIRQRNELQVALEDLVELCDDGPDLSQIGPDPVVLTRAKHTLKTIYKKEGEVPGPPEAA